MIVVDPSCIEHMEKTKQFAREAGRLADLEEQLKYLDEYACHGDPAATQCVLYSDCFASFYFVMNKRQEDGSYKRWFNGACIFHGKHDRGGDGGAPTFSVNLTPTDGWSIHT